MKKFLALLLAFVMLFAMVGCEKGESSDEKAEGGKTSGEKLPKFDKKATLDETEVYNSEGVTITVKELVYEDYCATLKVDIKNESNKNYNVNSGYAAHSVAVNGVTIGYTGLYSAVDAGKTEEAEMTFFYDNLQMLGIDVIAKLELGFEIEEVDNYENKTVTRAVLNTSAAESYSFDTTAYRARLASSDNQKKRHYELTAASADVCFDQEGVKVVSQHLVRTEDGGIYLLLEVENTGDETVNLSAQQMTVNGLKIQGVYSEYSCWVLPKTKGIMSCDISTYFGKENMEIYGLREIGEITYDISLRNTNYEPCGQTAAASLKINEEIPFDNSGKTLYESDDLRILMKEIVVNEVDGMNVLLLVENKRDQAIVIDAGDGDFTINGEKTDVYIGIIKLEPGQWGATVYERYDLSEFDIKEADDVTAFTGFIEVCDPENLYSSEAWETAEISFTR